MPSVSDFTLAAPCVRCPACNGVALAKAFITVPAYLCAAGFQIDRCHDCGLHFCNPQPSAESLSEFYRETFEPEAQKTLAIDAVGRYLDIRRRQQFMSARLAPLQKYITAGRVLNYGCGVGVFVRVLQDAGYHAEGIDISPVEIETGRELLGLDTLRNGNLDAVDTSAQYDAVVATTVIEHLADPSAFLGRMRRCLGPSGILALEFPTVDSMSFRLFGPHWYWIMTPYHLFYYSRKAMEALLEKCGFDVLGIEPVESNWMWAESFANASGMSSAYHAWRADPRFVQYTIDLDALLDAHAMRDQETSVLQVYARRR